jgi:hypothetical protein
MLKGTSCIQYKCFSYPSNGVTVSTKALFGDFSTVIGIAYERVRAAVKVFG